jgi:hypothetical protein
MNIKQITTLLGGVVLCAGLCQAQADFHHLSFNVGGGFTTATQGISNRLDNGGNFQASVGLQATKHLGVEGTFMFNGMGITRSALNAAGEQDGSARTYSITVDPKIGVWSGERANAYILGGGGWLRRTVEFTQPTLAQTVVFDPWFGYFGPALVPANQVTGSFSQNAGVWDVGAGMNFPLPRTSLKLYVEARYMDALTSSQHTTIVPITVGFHW